MWKHGFPIKINQTIIMAFKAMKLNTINQNFQISRSTKMNEIIQAKQQVPRSHK